VKLDELLHVDVSIRPYLQKSCASHAFPDTPLKVSVEGKGEPLFDIRGKAEATDRAVLSVARIIGKYCAIYP
jgi:hypothetical protein